MTERRSHLAVFVIEREGLARLDFIQVLPPKYYRERERERLDFIQFLPPKYYMLGYSLHRIGRRLSSTKLNCANYLAMLLT